MLRRRSTKSLPVLSLTALALALASSEGRAARATHRVAPLDDPPIAWMSAGPLTGARPRRRTFVPSTRVASRAVPAPEGDPPIRSRPDRAALGDLAPSLHDTGRIASPEIMPTAQSLKAATAASPIEAPPERAIRPLSIAAPAQSQEHLSSEAGGPTVELRGNVGSSALKQCRIEVARRRQVRLGEVEVGTLRLRWTVRPSGDVQDAEVIAAVDTDPSVAACVKRVLSMATFLPQPVAVAMERTYAPPSSPRAR